MRGLSATAKTRITPLVDLVEVSIDPKTKQPRKAVSTHVDDGLDALVSNWGLNDTFFIDPAAVSSGTARTFAGAASRKLSFIPVTGVYRSAPEIAAAVKHSADGLCLRIKPEDMLRPSLGADISAFVNSNSLKPSTVDAVLDLGPMTGQSAFVIVSAATAGIGMIPNLKNWRSLTLMSSAFPQHVGNVPRNGSSLVDRTDFAAWMALHAQRAKLQRLPTFGDYGIQHPTGVEGYDPRFMGQAAAIRYTLGTQWLLIKGVDKKVQALTAQYPALARKLVAHASYCKRTHCGGCECAYQCSTNKPGFGAAESWRRIGTHHHLEFVATQLAGVPYP